ncbi:MAG TPA: hypothetical protein PKD72_03845 [Gemmatales bacterium]|nr:hypothetical protein [Gemmatales bacterium]
MPYVMQYETWMQLTELKFKPRSKQLRSIDKALKTYHQAKTDQNLKKLKLALHHWKMYKGFDGAAGLPAWRTSERNQKKAVETLDSQINETPNLQASAVLADLAELPFYGLEIYAEDQARQAIKQAREEALTNLFQGRKMVINKTGLASTLFFTKRKIDKAKSEGSKAASAASAAVTGPIRQQAMQLVREMLDEVLREFPLEVVQEALKTLSEMIPDFLGEIAGAVAPYLSVATSGAKAVKNTAVAIKKEYDWVKTENHLEAFSSGDAFAAAEAIRKMIARDRNHAGRLAGIYGVDAAVKSAAIIADAAAYGAPTVSAVVTPLQGFATAMAVLSLQIYLIGRDFYEKHKANKILSSADEIAITPKLFQAHPLTGCYFVACTNTSDIINFLVEDIGGYGWKLDVENIVKLHIHPMQTTAREYIADARFVIEGLELSKGNVDPGGLTRMHKVAKSKLISKVKSMLPFVDNPKDYDVFAEQQQGQKVVSKEVLKSRIHGLGNR